MMTIHNTLSSLIPPKAWKASVSLVIADDNKKELHQFGTGTLLKVADASLLVTAAHVVALADDNKIPLCIASGDSFTQLHGNWYCSSDNTPFDVAILRLPEDVASQLEDVSYVRLNDVEFGTDLSKGVFCLLGYPNRMSRPSTPNNPTMQLKPFQYITYTHQEESDTLKGYQEKYHLLLHAEYDGTESGGPADIFADHNGVPLQFPKDLGGISGCAVWRLGNHDVPASEWGRNRPKIVAVQTGVYSERKVIKATRWIAVSTLINEAYPDLRPVLNLQYIE